MSLILATTLSDSTVITIMEIPDHHYIVSYIDGPNSECWREFTWKDAFQTYLNALHSELGDDTFEVIVQ